MPLQCHHRIIGVIACKLPGARFAVNRFRGIELSALGSPAHPEIELVGRRSGANAAPAISIVVPTRNRAPLLARALESMRSQSFSSFEVLVVDDGSTAATKAEYAAIWQNLDDRFVLHYVSAAPANGIGPSVSRNLGIAAARAPIIAFCDDDDSWTSNAHLAMMAEVFSTLPPLSVYIANQIAVEANGAIVKRSWLPGLEKAVGARQRSHQHGYLVTCEDLAAGGGFAQLNILAVSKALIESQGGFWTRTTYEEDRDFFWRAVDHAAAIFFNPTIVAQHNVPDQTRKENLSSNFSQVERWIISALVSQHIALSVNHRTIKRLCTVYEGDILRHLSLHFSKNEEHALGFQYACRAIAARASWKWSAYTFLLAFRNLMRKSAQ